MNTKSENLNQQVQDAASAYIGSTFTLVKYADNPENVERSTAKGTIQHHDSTVNVDVEFEKDTLQPRYWMITDDSIAMPLSYVGIIHLSEKVCVTDPCYERGTWCATELDNVLPGLWDVNVCIDEIDCWGKRTYILELSHHDVSSEKLDQLRWIDRSSLGVDSGQMSVFDDAHYRRKDGSAEAFEADQAYMDAFYDHCCNLSWNYVGIYHADEAAVGVVCSSGCGDGSYPLTVKEIDFKIVAMKISFV